MPEVRFQVQGSGAEPYVVTFTDWGDGNMSAHCTCAAGKHGQYCKHRFAILAGETKGIVSGNEDEVPHVVEWLAGSDIEAALEVLADAQAKFDVAKKKLSQAKKLLAKAMRMSESRAAEVA